MHKGAAAMHLGRSLAARHASLQRDAHRNEARHQRMHHICAHLAYRPPIDRDSAYRTAAPRARRTGHSYRLARALQ